MTAADPAPELWLTRDHLHRYMQGGSWPEGKTLIDALKQGVLAADLAAKLAVAERNLLAATEARDSWIDIAARAEAALAAAQEAMRLTCIARLKAIGPARLSFGSEFGDGYQAFKELAIDALRALLIPAAKPEGE